MPDVILPDPPEGTRILDSWDRRWHCGATGYVFKPREALTDRIVVSLGKSQKSSDHVFRHDGQKAIGEWRRAMVLSVVTAQRAIIETDGSPMSDVRPNAFALLSLGSAEPEPEPEPWIPGTEHLKGRRKKR